MVRTMLKAVVLALSLTTIGAQMAGALTLMSPTEGQTVRENIKFVFPSAALPKDGYVSLNVMNGNDEQLITATEDDSESITASGDQTTFIWNTKSAFFTSADDRTGRFIGDGQHTLRLHIHDVNGNTVDSQIVTVNVKNIIDRPSSEPAILLFYKLPYGQQSLYSVQSRVALFDSSDNPTYDTLRLSGEFKLSQSVEDVQPDGQRLVRYKVGSNAWLSYFGGRQPIYTQINRPPQVYRLVNKFGRVTDPDVVGGRNKNINVMDILQVLPSTPVKTGDTWPDKMNLKLEGLTDLINLDGTATLTGFEWQDGRECAKIESELKGPGMIRFQGIQSTQDSQITVKSITYFAYNENRAIRRDLDISFPAYIAQGTSLMGPTGVGPGVTGPGPMMMPGPMGNAGPGAMMPGPMGMPPGLMRPGMEAGMPGPPMPGPEGGAMIPGAPGGMPPGLGRPGMPGMGGFGDVNPTGGVVPTPGSRPPFGGAGAPGGMGMSGQQKGKAQILVVIRQEK